MFRRLATEILLVLAIGFILGLFGPFGTYAMPIGVRVGYWMVFGFCGYAIFRPLVIVGRWLSEALALSQIIGVGIAQLVAAAPMALLVNWLMTGFSLGEALASPKLVQTYFQVWLIGFLVYAFFSRLFPSIPQTVNAGYIAGLKIESDTAADRTTPSGDPPAEAKGLSDKLPKGFGPPIALKSEDHYVRVYSSDRDALLLMRLGDAVDGLGDVEGMRVHRSWWVARAGVAAVNRDGRTIRLRLTNGETVPVARDAVTQLKDARWI